MNTCRILVLGVVLGLSLKAFAHEPGGIGMKNLEVTTEASASYDVPISKLFGLDWLDGNVNVVADYVSLKNDKDEVFRQRVVKVANPVLFVSRIPVGRSTSVLTTPLEDGEPAAVSTIESSLISAFATIKVDGKLPIEIALGEQSVKIVDGELDLNISANINAELLPASVPQPFTKGQFELKCKLSGPSTSANVSCSAQGKNVEVFGQPFGEMVAKWEHRNDRSEASLTSKRGTFSAKIPIKLDLPNGVVWEENAQHEVAFDVRNVNSELLSFIHDTPQGMDYDVRTVGSFVGSMQEFEVSVLATGELKSGSFKEPISLEFRSDEKRQNLNASMADVATVNIASEVSIAALRKDESGWVNGSLSGDVSLKNVPLAMVTGPFSSVSNATGSVSGDLKVGGTLGSPSVDGTLATADAAMNYSPLNRRLTNSKFEATFARSKMSYEGTANVKDDAEEGLALVRGELNYRREGSDWELSGRQTVALDNVPFVRPDYAIGRATGSGSCDVSLSGQNSETTCVVQRTRIDISPEQLPRKRSVSTNPNIRFVDRRESSVASFADSDRSKITLELLEPVKIVGDGVSLEWTGKTAITREGPKVKVDGGFTTTKNSKISIFKNDFDVVSGFASFAEGDLRRALVTDKFGFTEPTALSPIAEIVLEGKVNDTYVLAKLSGEPGKPRLDLSAIPALPEYQIITLLVLGRLDSLDDRNGNVRRAAARIIERYHNPSLQRQLFDRIGIDKVGIKFGKSVLNPILTVGKQLNRTLYVQTTYRHDVPPDTNTVEARVEQRVATKWRVDTTFGDAAEGSVGLFWYSRFGGPKGTPPTEEDRRIVGQVAKDEDGDSIDDRFDLCLQKKEDLDGFEDDDGCPDLDNDGDGILDSVDKAPNERETFNGFEDTDGAPDTTDEHYVNFNAAMKEIVFAEGKTQIDSTGRLFIQTFADIAKQFEGAQVVIRATSDDGRNEKSRKRIARRRAQAAQTLLRRAGVASKRIVIEFESVAPPDSEPQVPSSDEHRKATMQLVFPAEDTAGPTGTSTSG